MFAGVDADGKVGVGSIADETVCLMASSVIGPVNIGSFLLLPLVIVVGSG
jgi:hypothetical protein